MNVNLQIRGTIGNAAFQNALPAPNDGSGAPVAVTETSLGADAAPSVVPVAEGGRLTNDVPPDEPPTTVAEPKSAPPWVVPTREGVPPR